MNKGIPILRLLSSNSLVFDNSLNHPNLLYVRVIQRVKMGKFVLRLRWLDSDDVVVVAGVPDYPATALRSFLSECN
jgi:hypothetical protein